MSKLSSSFSKLLQEGFVTYDVCAGFLGGVVLGALGASINLAIEQLHQYSRDIAVRQAESAYNELLTAFGDYVERAGDMIAAADAEVAALAKQLSDHVIPKTRAYHEIWYGEQRIATSEPEEPFYGRTYLPRKFKIGFAYRATTASTSTPTTSASCR